MSLMRLSLFFLLGFMSAGCFAVGNDKRLKLPVSYALEGTSTAVVGIAVDEKTGLPKETVSKIVLTPGQKVIFAGPDRFSISFKNKRAPGSSLRYTSKNGIITISIPKDILDDERYIKEYRKQEYLRFDYSIIVNGKELDPPIIIKRDS